MPKEDKNINNYINLRNRQSGQKINLNNHGVVISEKLANLLHLKPGDKLTLNTSNGRKLNCQLVGFVKCIWDIMS